MLILVAVALAAPPIPQLTTQGFAVGFGGVGRVSEDQLVDPDCTSDACAALRHRSGWGGLVVVQAAPFASGWFRGGSEAVSAQAAEYSASGFGFDGGLTANFLPKRDIGALAWGEGFYGNSGTEGKSEARRWGAKAGGAARFGTALDGVFVWTGGELEFEGKDTTRTQGGALEVPLRPAIPLNVVAGIAILSEPLAGAGSTSPRMFFTLSGSAGAELGMDASLGVGF